jgi:thiol:disulfide interchange protein DsbD
VFIDFTGYTCTNCRWMEANMFSRGDVSAAMSQFVLSRLFTDGEGQVYENQQKFQEERFGTVALPLYAIVDSNGRTIKTFSGLTRNPGEFIAFLNSGT